MVELPEEIGHYTSDDYRRDELCRAQYVKGKDGVVRWLHAVFSRHGGLWSTLNRCNEDGGGDGCII